MGDSIKDWQNRRQEVKASNKKLILKLSKLKAKELNNRANDVHEEAFTHIDCLDCASCRTSIPPLVNETDARRIARKLGIKLIHFKQEYLSLDEDKDWVMKSTPCVFLGDGNKCDIYEFRPKACREYPHTNDFQFIKNLNLHVENAYYCPAVYYILEKLKGL